MISSDLRLKTAFSVFTPIAVGNSLRPKVLDQSKRYRLPAVGCVNSFKNSRNPLPGQPTPITPISFRGRTWYVKRDDELNYEGVSGSKLRKLHKLFIDPALDDYDTIVSYGGAQSNAMLAIAHLCHYRRKQFVYITRQIPKHLSYSDGNFRRALDLNMFHIQIENEQFRNTFTDLPPQTLHDDIQSILSTDDRFAGSKTYFIPQGGACQSAEYGVRILAEEIRAQIEQMRTEQRLVNKRPVLFLPCGTGTTAYYLAKHLGDIAQVVAIPVSGSESYLIKQMRWLGQSQENLSLQETYSFPNVIRPRLRASFADVRPEKLSIWQELGRSTKGQFQFDLIYAPKAWEEVILAMEQGRIGNNGEDIFYYHTGGVEGNVSMLDRFKRKGMLQET